MAISESDIYILGTGMVGYRQITREFEQCFEQVERALLLHPLPEVHEFVHDQCEEIIDLSEEYRKGHDRTQSYERMAQTVLDAASKTDRPVAMVVYGHPLVGVTPTEQVRLEANQRNLTVRIIPGISSLDALYVDLNINPLDRGIQIFEATDLLAYNTELDPKIPALILQIGLVGTHGHTATDRTSEELTTFGNYLRRLYPGTHEIQAVRTATLPFAEPEKISVEVDEFESLSNQIDETHTLYVPSAERREIVDDSYIRRERDDDYSARNTDEYQ